MRVRAVLAIVSLSLVSTATIAQAAPAVPEPGVIELLAIGAVAGIAVAIRNRRK
jgi:hypothetical protein